MFFPLFFRFLDTPVCQWICPLQNFEQIIDNVAKQVPTDTNVIDVTVCKNVYLGNGKSLAAAARFKENWWTFVLKFTKRKYETPWFYKLHLSQQKIMILDRVSMVAIRPPKFTNKDSIFCMQTVVNSANLERNGSYNLLPSSILILLK